MKVPCATQLVICFQREQETKGFGRTLKERLGKFELMVAEEKNQIILFGKNPYYVARKSGKKLATFDFLGFIHYCTRTRRGYFRLGRKTSKVKFRERLKETNKWLKKVRNMIKRKEWWEVLRLKLIGHYRYYGISGNMPELKAFYNQVIWLTFKWINRRSQKRSYNWRQFLRLVKFNPLPKPKIYHLTYTSSSRWGCLTEEPCAGNLHAGFCEGH